MIDRDNVETDIDEPIGFDACTIVINRDNDKHGIIFDYQGNDFSFYGKALEMIQTEYETYGVEGVMSMVILQACDGGPAELYRGQLVFTQYKFFCGDECYAKIPLEMTGDIMTFSNRFDQKVNLQTLQAFDEITPLVPYDFLPLTISLPSKGILLKDKSLNETLIKEEILGATVFSTTPDEYGEIGMIEMANSKIIASEVGGFGMKTSPEYRMIKDGPGFNNPPFGATTDVYELPLPPGSSQAIHIHPRGTDTLVNWADTLANFVEEEITTELHFRIKGTLTKLNVVKISGFAFTLVRLNKTAAPDYIYINHLFLAWGTSATSMPGTSFDFDITFDDAAFVLNPDDEIYGFFTILHTKNGAQASDPDLKAFRIQYDQESFFDLSWLSHSAPTPAKVFMVNEALSRITEAITDDKIKAYSEYFGRTDSQPYNHAGDGCGALEVITKGLFIRQQENRLPPAQAVQMAISMKDMWEGLEPLHHIGFGFEDDTNRAPGFKRLRVEHWKFFYQDEILMECNQVNQVERQTIANEHYSKAKIGYEKWEAEEFNGLDELLTNREYRTDLAQVKNELSKLSKFIASGYAWEVTRRKNTDSKDWRLDNDIFLVCVTRLIKEIYTETLEGNFGISGFVTETEPVNITAGDLVEITGTTSNNGIYTIIEVGEISAPIVGSIWVIALSPGTTPEAATATFTLTNPGFIVELGNVLTPENIIDPATLYNYRLSPARVALRWLDKIFASYRVYSTSLKLIFVDGTGNYIARGEMESDVCKWEVGLMGENDYLYGAIVVNQDNVAPILRPERVDFEYPMSMADFKKILAAPYGIITWFNSCESGQGWIDKVSYKPETGLAKFTLIPKYE